VRTDADSFHGRAGAFGFSVDEGRVHFDGADAKSERGHALMLRSKHHLVVHDDRWTDRRRFLKDRLGEVRGALNSHALKLEKTATDLRDRPRREEDRGLPPRGSARDQHRSPSAHEPATRPRRIGRELMPADDLFHRT
jgi:hypothetical protein